MKTLIKTDFEKWLLSQLTEDDIGYFFTVDATKVYVYFEGEDGKTDLAHVRLQIIPSETTRPATGVKYHTGKYKLFIYGVHILLIDKIADALSDMLDEIIIEETQSFRIETGLLSTKTRGNKFYGSNNYESITEIPFYHWENI